MNVPAGSRLGPYEILGLIGAGGMGEVYRARDTRLGRDVAIKVSDEQFTERFAREARSIAALNHTNICHLYDVGPNYLVMELVEGETLSGPIELGDALPLIRQLIDGIEAAHDKNIVHRDLKPANIKITPEGVVKILDFGLAKATGPEPQGDPENSPTLTMGATQVGTILGTAAYMSPEQAKGKSADRRSDIWSFGVVVYELLTGKRPFEGETVVEILGAVINKTPDWDRVPPEARRLLEWCLEKERKQRLASISDARRMLENVPVTTASLGLQGSRTARVGVGAMVVLLAVIAALGWLRPREAHEVAPPDFKLSILPPKGTSFDGVGSRGSVPWISPDGTTLLFADTNRGLWMRRLDSLEARAVPTPDLLGWVFWSPDSKSIGSLGPAGILRVQLLDGSHETIAPLVDATRGGAWSQNGTILIAMANDTFSSVPATGGKLEPVGVGIPGRKLVPQFLPNSEDFLFTLDDGGEDSIYLASLRGGKIGGLPVMLRKGALGPQFSSVAGGVLLFVANDNLYQQKLDLTARKLTGEPKLLVRGVASGDQGEADFSVSNTGVLAWRPGTASASRLTWFDRKGHELGRIGPAANFFRLYLSPDERRVYGNSVGLQQSWIMDSASSEQIHLPWPGAVWSADGNALIEQASNGTLLQHPLANPKEAKMLGRWPHSGHAMDVVDAAPDGTLLFRDFEAHYLLRPGQKESEARRLPTQPGEGENGGRFSPDGRWIVYITTSGLYVQPVAFNGLRQQIASAGSQAVWRQDGKEILFSNAGMIWSVGVEIKGNQFKAAKPERLFDYTVPRGTVTGGSILAVTRDGSRILAPVEIPQPDSDVIHVTTIR